MATEVVTIENLAGRADGVARAARVMNEGGLVAFRTETVYGIGARADDASAVERLRLVKGRSRERALTVHVGAKEEVERFVPKLSGMARRLVRRGWPGPLTLVFPVSDPGQAPVMTGLDGAAADAMYYGGSVGLRCPDDSVAGEFLRAVESPVVASSANAAGRPPAQTGGEVLKEFGERIDLLLDGGRTKYAKPSTIIRLNGTSYEMLREGVLDARAVERMAVLRILFVCTGNTCRSPMAAGLAKAMIARQLNCDVNGLGRRGIVVESAGTAGGGGRAAENAVAVMAARGVDLSDHVSTALRADTLEQADYVFVMTRSHAESVQTLSPGTASRVQRLLEGEDLADPIGSSREAYEACAATIERGLESRLKEINL